MGEYLNHWDKRFDEEQYIYGKAPNQFLAGLADRLLPGETLAIAEGEGRNAAYLAKKGHRVTTWDYAPSGIRKTLALAEEMGVEVRAELKDLEQAVWEENKWDNMINVFGHFPTPLRMKTLKGVKQAVKPGGFFLTEVYSVHQLVYKTGGPRDIELLYRPEEFLQVFADWKIIHFFMGEAERHEGELHNGKCHVIQLLAQKTEAKY
ncbi:SAM-dependent methyltransferase [Bacillus benzoevorans]|uniref:SAM-dependent methyltransferase n=1 Tax=Bacillus benzoevorans TaxID=1456 RepID=A0A7X0HMM2_9BACI|nr:class I SAM-dependent methyltransferase [Bacillus benzoevorans]MBB6443587.1 SAM-dependent methyltransferase [Bacillus benzoevorans]